MTTATKIDTVLAAFPPGAEHWITDDGGSYAVLSQCELDDHLKQLIAQALVAHGEAPTKVPLAGHRVAPRPTVIIECNDDGIPVDMIPEWSFPAGTSPSDAMALAGFSIA